jgi:hypothetical protein
MALSEEASSGVALGSRQLFILAIAADVLGAIGPPLFCIRRNQCRNRTASKLERLAICVAI